MINPEQQLQQFSFGLKLNSNVVIGATIIAYTLEEAHTILQQDVMKVHDLTNVEFEAQVIIKEVRKFGRKSGLILPSQENGKVVNFN